MQININVPEEVAITTCIRLELSRLEAIENKTNYMKNKIKSCNSVLEKIKNANNKQAQEIMRNEG